MKYSHNPSQLSIFDFNNVLKVNLDENNELVKMRKLIPWDELIDIVFKKYSDFGRPSRSVLLMLCLEILKRRFQLSDNDLFGRFKVDISFQYFCGFSSFAHGQLPLDTSNMTKFRNRLDENTLDEIENIVTRALIKYIPKKRRHSIIPDSTCLPANITFPTDTKLLTTVFDKAVKAAKAIGIKLIKGKRKIKNLIRSFNLKRRKTFKEITNMRKKLVRACNKVIAKVTSKITDTTEEVIKTTIDLAKKIVAQQEKRNSEKTNIIEDRIVSFHEPNVRPIKRGKDGAKCEFGKKVGFSVIGETLLVTAKIDNNNFDDRELVLTAIEKHNRITGRDPTEQIMDRGGHSKTNHDLLEKRGIKDGIQRKGKQKDKPTRTQIRQRRRRSVVEGKIGTAKQWYGLNRNRYKEDNAKAYTVFGLIAMNTTCIIRKAA